MPNSSANRPVAPIPASARVLAGAPDGFCRLFSDGASRGNPGHAGAGAVLVDASGVELARVARYLGVCTNNAAEYQALLLGLEAALDHGCERIALFMDSELIVRQLEGAYRVRHPQLQALHARARQLLGRFSAWRVAHVPRAENAAADRLANAGIDSRHAGGQSGGLRESPGLFAPDGGDE